MTTQTIFTCILLNLPGEYQTIVKILEDELDDKNNTLPIERIYDKILVKIDQMNEQSRPRTSQEDEKYPYLKSQYKGIFTTCRKYGHMPKDFWHR